MKKNEKYVNLILTLLFAVLATILVFSSGTAKAEHPANECMELLTENPQQWGEEANSYLADIYPEYVVAATTKPELQQAVSSLLVRACNDLGDIEMAVDLVVEMSSAVVFDLDEEVSP